MASAKEEKEELLVSKFAAITAIACVAFGLYVLLVVDQAHAYGAWALLTVPFIGVLAITTLATFVIGTACRPTDIANTAIVTVFSSLTMHFHNEAGTYFAEQASYGDITLRWYPFPIWSFAVIGGLIIGFQVAGMYMRRLSK